MKKKPTILVTNDDGITAPGINHLVNLMKTIGEVLVVAPNSPQSGMGHAITLEDPLRVYQVDVFDGVESWECSGTPVDCVKLAKNVIFKDKNIDLCVSGINHGSNAGINIIYSGTMSAAMEASLENIDSIGFSLLDFKKDAVFNHADEFILNIVQSVLDKKLEGSRLLNVNIPKKSDTPIKGIKVCRQGKGNWEEAFIEGTDPRGRNYYWLSGEFINQEHSKDTDLWALSQNYISVVPSTSDLTDYQQIANVNQKINEA